MNELEVNEYLESIGQSAWSYDGDQMYEIARGLDRGIDITAYVDPKFNAEQMYEIYQNVS